MEDVMHERAGRILAVAIGLGLVTGAVADEDHGKQGGAEWQRWALSIPTAHNPIFETTGADCMVGQRGSTWLLGGLWGGGTVTRVCSIPEDTELFFPLINTVNVNSPNVCGQGGDQTAEELRAQIAGFVDGASDLSVELDGREHVAELRRVQSPPFVVALPEDNLFNVFCGGPGSVPAGIYSPAVDDGIYATIRANHLTPGRHRLHFHAEQRASGFVEDVTYDLTVVRDKRR
jgi:hypothetical protein